MQKLLAKLKHTHVKTLNRSPHLTCKSHVHCGTGGGFVWLDFVKIVYFIPEVFLYQDYIWIYKYMRVRLCTRVRDTQERHEVLELLELFDLQLYITFIYARINLNIRTVMLNIVNVKKGWNICRVYYFTCTSCKTANFNVKLFSERDLNPKIRSGKKLHKSK